MQSFRTLTLTFGTTIGMLLAGPALAASITVEQVGAPNTLGSWVLRGPDGRTWHGNAALQTVTTTDSGTYTLNVQPPTGTPDITVALKAEDGTTISETDNLSLSASLRSDRNYRFEIKYNYESLITIESVPTNAPYTLEDFRGRVVASGNTPDEMTLPSGTYTVKYGFLRGCAIPKPQSRATGKGETVHFIGRYVCGRPVSSSSRSAVSRSSTSRSSKASSSRSSSSVAIGQVSISIRPQQREAVPGGSVMYTLTLRNEGDTAQQNLLVYFNIDPTQVTIRNVPSGAVMDNGRLRWQVPDLARGRSWSVQFPVYINEKVTAGTRIQVTSSVEGPMIDRTQVTNTIGVTALPATGAALDLWFAMATAIGALFLTLENRRRQRVA